MYGVNDDCTRKAVPVLINLFNNLANKTDMIALCTSQKGSICALSILHNESIM